MASISKKRVKLGQASGPEIELIVSGDEDYAHYETPDGYAVVYDAAKGLFCHARLVNGCLEPTSLPASQPPSLESTPHEQESAEVRRKKTEARRISRGRAAGD